LTGHEGGCCLSVTPRPAEDHQVVLEAAARAAEHAAREVVGLGEEIKRQLGLGLAWVCADCST
jgi:hypothetical protein